MTNGENSMGKLPGIRDVWAARSRISGSVVRTPLVRCPELSEEFDAEIYLKLELYQPIGAFKIRGAANKILSLTIDQQRRG